MTDLKMIVGRPFVRSESGETTGTLYLRVDGWSFPEAGWLDFVTIVLDWWLSALNTLATQNECTFAFMDGPHEIRAIRKDESIHLSFISRTARGSVLQREAEVPYAQFIAAMIEACEGAVKALRASGMEVEADTLSGTIASFGPMRKA